jgi:DNA-binding NarL/FixJ family response regulator
VGIDGGQRGLDVHATEGSEGGAGAPVARSVAVVDRAQLDRDLMVHVLGTSAGCRVVGAFATLLDTSIVVDARAVLIRAGAPGSDLVAEVRAARATSCSTIVVVAAHVDHVLVEALVGAGATSVLSTASRFDEVLARLDGTDAVAGMASDSPPDVDRCGLTDREMEVLHLLADGITPQQIARRIELRLSTVRDHVRSLREKLGCATATEVVVAAHRLGLAPHVGRPLR